MNPGKAHRSARRWSFAKAVADDAVLIAGYYKHGRLFLLAQY